MSAPAVQFSVQPSVQRGRIHVLIRLVLLLAVGMLGWSSFYWLAYLVLPAIAALLIAQRGPAGYLADDAPRIARALRWIAGAYAYLWLLTDAVPTAGAEGPVQLQIETVGTPTPGSALLRLLYSLPALLLLVFLSIAAAFLWLIGALAILASERLPQPIDRFISLKLRYQFRLLVYHLSLVERYPSLEEAPAAKDPMRSGTG